MTRIRTLAFVVIVSFSQAAALMAQRGGQPASPFQLRVTGTCAVGSAIRQINADGTVVCENAGSSGVTDVTASAPLVSSGGTTPNLSLPGVIITDNANGNNAAVGAYAL